MFDTYLVRAFPIPNSLCLAFKMSAVDALTTDMAATAINETANTNGTAPAATQAADAAAASADEGRRLYIGNLAYATTEEELKEFFKSYTM